MQPTPGDAEAIGYDAIAEVQPGGHFFAAAHTMARYRTAFYQPLVADLSNFGNWTESGAKTATERANGIWKRVVDEYRPIERSGEIGEALDGFIAKRMSEGGAEAVS
jgi:trimethylamine--corrinoid protein Co-methyltransferase